MRMSFNARLSWQTSLILSLTMLVVFAYTWVRAQDVVRDLSGRIVSRASEQAGQNMMELLDQAERQTSLLSGLASPKNTIDPRTLDRNDFKSLGEQMVEMLNVSPELSTVSVVLDATGEYVSATRKTGGSLWLTTAVKDDAGQWTQTSYARYGGVLEPGQYIYTPPPDLRNDVGYVRAKEAQSLVWTDTRMVARRGEPDLLAITCAVPVFDAMGRTVGVASADVSLGSLSQYVQRIDISEKGYAFLAELRTGGQPRIIAHPDPSRLLVSDQGRLRLATAQELGDDAVNRLLSHIQSLKDLNSSQSGRVSFESNGRAMLAGYHLLSEQGRPQWMLGIVVPTEDFMGNLSKDRNFLIVFAVVALMAGIYVSLLLAYRISLKVAGVLQETVRIQSLDLSPRPVESSNIEELDRLSEAMESLKTNLRSFEKLVPAQYARHLLATGKEAKLGGERRHVTIYFADIVGFTRLSEMMPPEELVEVLAEYLDVLSGKVTEHEGTVDKFNGDDVMAFWGAPNPVANPALKACIAALRSRDAIRSMHSEWRIKGMPLLGASFGISTGDVVVGNVGSRERMNYTVIGDAVNLASRFQGLNKLYETEILIGTQTKEEAGDAIVTRILDYVAVSGRERPARIYELVGLAGEVGADDLRIAELHNAAMDHYRAQRFVDAADGFRTIVAMREKDGPARILLKRCLFYAKNPPGEDWDGSYRAETK